MRIAVFDTHRYDRAALEAANQSFHHELTFFEPRLTLATAPLAHGYPVVCSFAKFMRRRPPLQRAHRVRLFMCAERRMSYGQHRDRSPPQHGFCHASRKHV